MSHAECPECGSESVNWQGSYHICLKCKKWGHHQPCIYCQHPETEYHESWARCGDCEWSGDPYDLIDVEDEEPEENE